MDSSTLFSANILLLSIFATSFLAISFRVSPRGHWRSWAAANGFLAAALLCRAFEPRLPLLAAYLLPGTFLLLGLGLHWHAARLLSRMPSGLSNVLAPATAYMLVAVMSYLTDNFALAYTASNVIFTLLCIAIIGVYTSPMFGGMISAIGLILAFFVLAAEGLFRATHGFVFGGPIAPDMMSNTLQDLNLMCSLIFVSLTGAFALAISFEQIAQRHREAARRDPLTNTFNRREFQGRLEETLQKTPREAFCLLHFDLDHFKQVNDRFGHPAGDEALVKISKAVKSQLRQNDCFARIGGEEFAVLLPEISLENAYKVADRLRERISEIRFGFSPDGFRITASFGVYHGTGDGLSSRELLQIVDKRLYQSKNEGRNRISIALPGESLKLSGQIFGAGV